MQSLFEREPSLASAVLCFGQTSNAVLDHNHGAIHDQPEIQCAQAHQIGRYARAHHACNRRQHRQRDDRSSDQRRAHVAQQQEQHDDDQQCPFEQVLLHGGDGFINQRCAVIQGLDVHAIRQRAVDGLDTLGDIARHGTRVLTKQHHGGANHGLLAGDGRRPRTQLSSERDLGNIVHQHRDPLALSDYNLLDVGDALQQPR